MRQVIEWFVPFTRVLNGVDEGPYTDVGTGIVVHAHQGMRFENGYPAYGIWIFTEEEIGDISDIRYMKPEVPLETVPARVLRDGAYSSDEEVVWVVYGQNSGDLSFVIRKVVR